MVIPNRLFKRDWRFIFCALFALQVLDLAAATYTVTTVNDSGTGSLRTAITSANGSSGNTVAFNISGTGPFTIALASVLPTISSPMVIDGTTQPGYAGTPLIVINGLNIASGNDGLMVTAGGCTIRGLAINRCPRDGIRLSGPNGTNVIQGNYLGTDATGTVAEGNGEGGVMVNGSPGNLIGGTTAATRNIISGNANGIYLANAASSNNVVEGNYIGISVTGLKLGNTNNGFEITAAPGNIIGGTVAGTRNVISGNGESGIYLITSGATNNLIEGNYIGLNTNGTGAIGNSQDGVTIYGVAGNTVGGTSTGARNIISGNGNAGVDILITGATSNSVLGNYIGTDVTGKLAVPNSANGVIINGVPGNTVGGTNTGAGNIISGNQQNGVLITSAGASGNLVQSNYIGVDSTGANPLPNTYDGIQIYGAVSNLIGGSNGGNVISGNTGNGVLVTSGGGTNIVQGNLIGTDYTGTIAVSNAQAGIYITVPGNTIGGLTAAVRNVISGNGQNGIFIYGASASNNLVEGNYIGTSITGETPLGNYYAGIAISNAPANTIGGTTAGARNVISANGVATLGDSGIELDASTTATIVQGNYIGTDATGSNALGNIDGGIYFYGSGTNTIGGTSAGAGNLISGNYQEGLSVGDPGANSNIIQGNFIGTKADGISPLGNSLHNIDFSNTASNNVVGGTTPAGDNHIAFAQSPQYDGVRIRAGCLGNFVSRNSIFSNAYLGIVIGSPAQITSPNMVTLTEVVSGNGTTIIQGSLSSAYANGQFLVQFYENVAPNALGYGEGLTYIGSTNITTGGNDQASFALSLPVGIPSGNYVTATATDSTNTTWQFSADYKIVPNTSSFSGLTASQPATYGTTAITLAGKVSAPGPIYPAAGETIIVSINGNAQSTITSDSTGDFSITYNPSTIPYSASAYPITYSYAGDASLTGATNTSTALTVNKAALSITAGAQSKTYGAAFNLGTSAFTPGGLQNGETVGAVTLTASGSPAGTATNAPVGAYTITPSAATGGTFNAANYNITYNTGTLTVNTAALKITASPQSKTYGQTLTFGSGSTLFTSSGLSNNETIGSVTLAVSGNGGAATTAVGTYTITPSAATGGSGTEANYNISYNTGTLTVNTATVTISSGITANNKIYDGTTTGTISSNNVSLSGVIGADTGNVNLSTNGYTATFVTKNVTNNIAVTVSGLTLIGSAAANYTLSQPNLTANIIAKALTMSGLSVPSSKVYDGTTAATASGSPGSLTGSESPGSGNSSDGKWYSGDTVSLTGTATGTYNSKNVGTASSVTFGGLSLTGAQAGNYSLTIQSAASATITAESLNITANAQSKTYGTLLTFGSGSTNFASSGLQNGETVGTVTLAVSGNGGATNAPVGTYTITPSAATGGTFTMGNYNIAYNTNTLTVTLPPNTIPVTITSIALQTNGVQMTFAGTPGYVYLIEAATNLAPPITWTTLNTNPANSNGMFSFTDLGATNYNDRYYRTATH